MVCSTCSDCCGCLVHAQVTALFYSGNYLSDVQDIVPQVADLELLAFQAPGRPAQEYDTSGGAAESFGLVSCGLIGDFQKFVLLSMATASTHAGRWLVCSWQS